VHPHASVVSRELADAALAAVPLARARDLAAWVGPERELTGSGVLRPAIAIRACDALGIEIPPGRLLSAKRIPRLNQEWDLALAAGFLIRDQKTATVANDLPDLADPDQSLQAWMRAVTSKLGIPSQPCAGCLTVLHGLSLADEPFAVKELDEAVIAAVPLSAGEDVTAFPFWDWRHHLRHTEHATQILLDFAAAEQTSSQLVVLTPLGQVLAHAIFSGCAPPYKAHPAEVVAMLGEVPPMIALAMAEPWFAVRGAVESARQLLAFAEAAPVDQRFGALAVTRLIGPDAAPAWREWAGRLGFGAYAREWLMQQGEPEGADPADEGWLAVDALHRRELASFDYLDSVIHRLLDDETSGLTRDKAQQMADSGHPEADRLVELLIHILDVRDNPPSYDYWLEDSDEYRWIPD
jgi:hypothetical protein